jgi:hypothetical protein
MKLMITVMLVSASLSVLGVQGSTSTDKVVKEKVASGNDARNSQRRINSIADATETATLEYRRTLKMIDNAKSYNETLRNMIQSQKEEMVSMEGQIVSIEETKSGLVPLMKRMNENLKSFVELDMPFLPEERKKRIGDLAVMMNKADVSTSEKFRRILEGYQIENEYGRTIEAYRGIQKRDGNDLTVDFLRVGRVALMYQSLDASVAAFWDQETKTWVDLGSVFRKSIREGLRMARKQAAPQLIKMPIKAPKA